MNILLQLLGWSKDAPWQAWLNGVLLVVGLFEFGFLSRSLWEGNGARLKASAIPGYGVAIYGIVAILYVVLPLLTR